MIRWIRGLFAAAFFLRSAAADRPRYDWPFPESPGKKGLQVQMVDDALALGVQHAALNLNLAQLVDLAGAPGSPAWTNDLRVFHFRPDYLGQMDRQVRSLSEAGAVVSIILLAYQSGQLPLDALLLHPDYSRECPNHLGAFNNRTPEGRAWLTAAIQFLAERWSRPDRQYGRVANWIVGNEVNSHWFWANCGRVTLGQFADDYLQVMRLAQDAVHSQSANSRVYVSLEHHWNIRYPGGDDHQAFPGREFLDYFAARARAGGDFAWHLAFHPYPENLFEPRTWKDISATTNVLTTPRITFKNLELLPEYLRRSELLFQGRPRRILLSEQGFHTPDGADGEAVQAAAYCYAVRKVAALPGIDAFILHRHVDHGQEGGLRLGLWSRDMASSNPAQPQRKKPIYEVFRAAGTSAEDAAFAFALPIIGWTNWSQMEVRRPQ